MRKQSNVRLAPERFSHYTDKWHTELLEDVVDLAVTEVVVEVAAVDLEEIEEDEEVVVEVLEVEDVSF